MQRIPPVLGKKGRDVLGELLSQAAERYTFFCDKKGVA